MDLSVDRTSPAGVPLWLKLTAIPVTVVVLLAGLWFFGGVAAPGYDSSIAFGAAWFVAAPADGAVPIRHPAAAA